jgi:hypothetical protein
LIYGDGCRQLFFVRAHNQKAAEKPSFSAATNGRTRKSSNILIFRKTQNLAGFFPFLEVFPSVFMSVSCNSMLEVSLSNVCFCTWVAHVMSIILTIGVAGPMGYAHVKGGTPLFVGQGIHIFHQLSGPPSC